MAWVLLSPVNLLLRPAMVPIGGGLAGLFYGTYDLTLMSVGTLTGMKRAEQCTFGHKLSTFGAGFGLSGASVYVRWVFDPPPLVPKIEEEVVKGLVESGRRHIRQSARMIRFFPYAWYCSSVGMMGFVTGCTVALTR